MRCQIQDYAFLGPQKRLLFVEVAQVGRRAAGHHGADLLGVGVRDVLATHFDAGLAVVECLDHLLDRFALERRSPEGEGQLHGLARGRGSLFGAGRPQR